MLFVRLLILVVVVVAMSRCNVIPGGNGKGTNDRISIILDQLLEMGKRMDSLTSTVGEISTMEENAAEHILKTEDKVEKLAKDEGEISKEVDLIKTQMGRLEQKVDKVDSGWTANVFPFGWKSYGFGTHISASKQFVTFHTTFPQCVAICNAKRYKYGTSWNGLWWEIDDGTKRCCCNQNDKGHTENPGYLHFRIE